MEREVLKHVSEVLRLGPPEDSTAQLPATQLELLARMALLASLERAVRIALRQTACDARAAGASWRKLGEATETDTTNAWQRWHKAAEEAVGDG
jgi:hypothetical protein